MTTDTITIGTRGSVLALTQTNMVADMLRALLPGTTIHIQIIRTQGDEVIDKPLPEIGGKGLFTTALETALLESRIDLAVHSLKDLPVEQTPGLIIGAVPRRVNPADVLISQRYTLATLPQNARIGTSSRRRAAQLMHHRPDFVTVDIRGNVDTRLQKAMAGADYDAIVLAYAGLERLDRLNAITESLPFDLMLPAPGQGALAVQCRDDDAWRAKLSTLNHADSAAAVNAERAFLGAMGGGCSQPIAAYGTVAGTVLHLHGRISTPDGKNQWDAEADYDAANPESAGKALAENILGQGAVLA